MNELIFEKEKTQKNNFDMRIEKENKILSFLTDEVFSTFNILDLILKTNKGDLSRVLASLVKKELLATGVIDFLETKTKVWGITINGLARVDPQLTSNAYFNLSKLGITTAQHRFDNQKVRIALQAAGYTKWENADRKPFIEKYQVAHRPDAVMTNQDGNPIAIETERTLKNYHRYKSIIRSHLLARSKAHWHYVYYILPNESLKKGLESIFENISYIIINGKKVELEGKHRRVFKFFTYEDINNLNNLKSEDQQ